jgi:hypothetical protein
MFEQKVNYIYPRLIKDLNISPEDAYAIIGNLAHETGGFKHMQELKPIRGVGGYGWAQWTGARRKQFFDFAAKNKLDPKSDEANYRFLIYELKGSEKAALRALKAATGLYQKVVAFEKTFERAGVKAYPSRYKYAQKAQEVIKKNFTPQTTAAASSHNNEADFNLMNGA